MDEDWRVSETWQFRESEFQVSASVSEGCLCVQVTDTDTADQWRGRFQPKHVEELTRKTGNFKSFAVFVKMLESAIVKSSDSVSLELLTYADLETMRSKKGHSHSSLFTKRGSLWHKGSLTEPIHDKKYLILTYSAEFDRIHYPLALPFAGKPDPRVLQEIIRQLKQEVVTYQNQMAAASGSETGSSWSLAKLKKRYDALVQEKEDLEEEFENFRREVEAVNTGTTSREVRAAQKIIHNLEAELLKEKSKYQRTLSRKSEEIQALIEELEEARSSERMLQIQVKNLTSELALMRKGVVRSGASLASYRSKYAPSGKKSSSSTKQGSSVDKFGVGTRSGSRRRNMSPHTLGRRTQSPSPNGIRFDPTAFVKNKQRKQDEIRRKLERQRAPCFIRNRSRSNSTERRHFPPRPSPSPSTGKRINAVGMARSRSCSVDSKCSSSSRRSSHHSSLDYYPISGKDSSYHQQHNNKVGVTQIGRGRLKTNSRETINSKKRHPRRSKGSWESPTVNSSTPKLRAGKNIASRKDTSTTSDNHFIEMEEIDARLSALQHFMKKSLDSVQNTFNR